MRRWVWMLMLPAALLAAVATALPIDADDDDAARPGRIVNGKPAQIGQLPYQVSLQLRASLKSKALVSSRGRHFCGGTRIANNWVATAAHCVHALDARNLQVVEGAVNISDPNNPVYKVRKIISHRYNDKTKRNDIALLRLEPDESMSSRASDHPSESCALPSADFDPTNMVCIVSGWGRLKSKGGAVPDLLQETDVRVVSSQGCRNMLDGYPWDDTQNTMICAGGADKDACQGDSGGPLVCTKDNVTYLVGIVSWGVGCATEGVPGAYTNVTKYLPWIKKKMADYDNRLIQRET